MADIEKCEDCKAWNCGICHRYPPVPMSNRGTVYGWEWPRTRYDDWCMEFMRRGPKEACHTTKVKEAKKLPRRAGR